MALEYKQSSRSFEEEKKNSRMPDGVTIQSLGDRGLRSFMGEGNARFDINGKVQKGVNGGPDITRRNAIDDIRTNLMERMKEVNLDAVAEANKMRAKHLKNFNEMNKHFKLKEAATRKKKTLDLKYKYYTGDKQGFIAAIRALNDNANTKYNAPAPKAAPASKIQVQYAPPVAPVAPSAPAPASKGTAPASSSAPSVPKKSDQPAQAVVAAAPMNYLSLKDANVKRALAAVLHDKKEDWRVATLAGYKVAKDAYKDTNSLSLHYVTIIGISADEKKVKYLDSSGYKGAAKEEFIDEFLKYTERVEIQWISDDIDITGLVKGNSYDTQMSNDLDALTLTRGDVYTRVMEGGGTEAMYAPKRGARRDVSLLEDSIGYFNSFIKAEEAKEAEDVEETVELPKAVDVHDEEVELKEGVKATDRSVSIGGFIQPAILEGMEDAYEQQNLGNNCYAVTEAALLSHYFARKKGRKVTKDFNQDQVRAYKPLVRRDMLAPGTRQVSEPITAEGALEDIKKYAGPDTRGMGNIFTLGDFIMDQIIKGGYIASLKKSTYDTTMGAQAVLNPAVKDQAKDRFSAKIRSIIEEGAVAGVLLQKKYTTGRLRTEEDVVPVDYELARYFCFLLDPDQADVRNSIEKLEGNIDSLDQVFLTPPDFDIAKAVARVLNPQALDEDESDVNEDGASSTYDWVESSSPELEKEEEEVPQEIEEDKKDQAEEEEKKEEEPIGDLAKDEVSPTSVPTSPSPEPKKDEEKAAEGIMEETRAWLKATEAMLAASSASSLGKRERASSITAASSAASLPAPRTRQRRESVSKIDHPVGVTPVRFNPASGADIQVVLQPTKGTLGTTKWGFWDDVMQYSGLYDDLLANIAANKTPRFVETRKKWNRDDYAKETEKEIALDKKIENECSIWRTKYELYKRDVVKKLDDEYDNLAQSWYELTHEYALETLGDKATQKQISDLMQERSIKGESVKDISEYAGIYDLNMLRSQLNYALRNPYHDLQFEPLVTKAATGYADSTRQGIPRPTVAHKTFSMYSTEKGGNGERTRYVFDANLQGRRFEKIQRLSQNGREAYFRAHPQYEDPNKSYYVMDPVTKRWVKRNAFRPPNSPLQPPAAPLAAEQPAVVTLQPLQYAEKFGLDLDEKGANKAFIHSELNGKIYRLKRKGSKETVLAFYSNGQMIMNETRAQGKNGRFSTTADLDIPDEEYYKEAEELRAAIRRSPFFNHVNATTIQLYAEYQAVAEFGNALNEKLKVAYGPQGDRAQDRLTNRDSLQQNGEGEFANISPSLWGDALAAYIAEVSKTHKERTAQVLSTDRVFKHVLTNKKDAVVQAVMILLLEENSPDLWVAAKGILEEYSTLIAFRSRVMLDKLDISGDLMRTALLNELANHQGMRSEFHPEQDEDLTSFIQIIPQITVWKEEMMNRRDIDSRFFQHVINGEIFKKIFGVISSAAGAGFQFYDSGHDDSTLSDEQKEARADGRQNALWAAYGDTVASGTRIMAMAEGIIGGVGFAINFGTGDWSSNSVGNQMRNYGTFGLEDLITYINGTAQIIRIIARLVKRYKESGTAAAAAELQSKTPWADVFKEILNLGTTLVDMAQALRDLFSNGGFAESEVGGYVDRGLKIIRELIDFINHCVDIHIGRVRKESLTEADSVIESAIEFAVKQEQERRKIGGAPFAAVANPQQKDVEELAGDINASDPTDLTRQVGEAAMQNSQVQFYLSLTRDATKKGIMRNSYALGRDVVAMTRDALAIGAKATKDPGTMIATGVFTLAPYVIDFARWLHGKLGYDLPGFKKSIGIMLGDTSFIDKPYFNEVLERETGIVNADYLQDLARIFTAIDTHVLVTNPQSPGEYELGRTLVSGLYDNVLLATMKKLKLSDMLKFSGFKEGSDWRAVLRHSLTG